MTVTASPDFNLVKTSPLKLALPRTLTLLPETVAAPGDSTMGFSCSGGFSAGRRLGGLGGRFLLGRGFRRRRRLRRARRQLFIRLYQQPRSSAAPLR